MPRAGEILHWQGETTSGNSEHITFLGIYNANPFEDQIRYWLPRLDLTGTHLIIADNCSTDDSLLWLLELAKKIGSPLTIVKNSNNFGGHGNLVVNMNSFMDAKWITTLHQDDSYKPEHIIKHKEVIDKSNAQLGMVCTEAKSVRVDGKSISYPRANWLLSEEFDPLTTFLANLKIHTFPFSGATFSKSVLEKYPVPWHSTAFPDTEIVLKMCVEHEIKFAKGLTVEYFENPNSESHSLTQLQRDFGAFQALARVFSHPSYEELCKLVDEQSKDEFVSALVSGLSGRLEDSQLKLLLTQLALEITAGHIGYVPALLSNLVKGYSSIGDNRAVDVLISLGGSKPIEAGPRDNVFVGNATGRNKKSSYRHFLILARFVPISLQPKVLQFLMHFRFFRKRFSSWDFNWKTK
jgi:hypothetical protein